MTLDIEVDDLLTLVPSCPNCDEQPEAVSDDHGWDIACAGCYDGTPMGGDYITGRTLIEALRKWREYADEARDERARA